MKIELGTIINLENLLHRVFNEPIPVLDALKLQETVKNIKADIENFHEIKDKVLKELGEKKIIDDREVYSLGDNLEKFNSKIRELLGVKNEYKLEFITDSFLIKNKINISGNEILALHELKSSSLEENTGRKRTRK